MGIKIKLILSLEENGFYKNYYEISNSTGLCLFFLDEFDTSRKQDYYTIYFKQKQLIENFTRCESKSWIPIKNNWWSYCPKWVYLNPIFIENNFRQLINNEIYKSLDGIFETDLTDVEKFRFKIWMKACLPETYQLSLFT